MNARNASHLSQPAPPHTEAATLADLSPGLRALVRMCQEVNFGRIERLLVRRGEPLLDPPPTMVRVFKFGGDNQPRSELGAAGFALRRHALEMVRTIMGLADGEIDVIEVRHGLPFSMDARLPARR